MQPKINFITVSVSDVEKSKTFYQKAFGFRISEQDDKLCLFEMADNFYFVIQQCEDFIKQTDNDSVEVGTSTSVAQFILSHQAVSQHQVEEIVSQAEANGGVRIKTLEEDWGYSVTIKDIDNHHWEIVYNKNSSS